ncbi:MAG: endo-1,4-beta-xylanase [Treponema sp.]|jgi:endo-1,4-beta-xylanase|nr:endo-1,4-beta-xylanase [Treponema sp.]
MRNQKDLLESVLGKIENNLKNDINADELSEDFSLSSVHLQRLFKQAFNKSVGAYIRSRKLSASIRDLLYSGLNVQDIALEYGFSYEQAYILSFRREFGFTPGDLRRNRYLVKTTLPLKPFGQMSMYENYFLVGSIINEKYIDDSYFSLIKNHFNTVTPQNNLKPILLTSNRGGAYNWDYADQMVNRVLENGIPVHGHVLVWHDWTPEWLTKGTKAEVDDNLKNYITDVLTHYHGRINSWDVVNEAIRDNLSAVETTGDWKKCLRADSPWYKALGANYIETAFRAAREAAPDITLYYNDYGLEYPRKADAVWKMINDINNRYKKETGQERNLIEGLGIQSHYNIKNFDENKVRSSLRKFTILNIELSISELDITTSAYEEGEGKDIVMTEHDAAVQAFVYSRLFKLYREYAPYISRVTMWGIDDHNSWLSAGNPCLFDRYLIPKKAFNAVFNTAK